MNSLVFIRDDTHMKSLPIYVRNSSTPLSLDAQFPTNPPSFCQVITNQWKENIIQAWLLYVIRSSLQIGFRFQYQLINFIWLSLPLPVFPFYFFSLFMWTNKIKTKTKPSYVTFKLATRSIVWFSPQTIQWYH